VTSAPLPLISVIIPTFHDWDRLALCLAALTDQTLDAATFEIIVANNDPNDTPPADSARPSNAIIVPAPDPGSYAARNAALEHARAPLIAFTDSDCVPKPAWLENAVTLMNQQDDIDIIAGDVTLFWQGEEPTTVELCDSLFFLNQESYAAQGFGATANVITRRSVFDAVGPFDQTLMSGGDMEWTKRASAAGHRLIYSPQVMVKHPARTSFMAMQKKSRRLAGGVIAKKRAAGRRFILPQLDRLLPSVRVARELYANPALGLWDGIKVFGLHYTLRLSILFEQIRLLLPGTKYQT